MSKAAKLRQDAARARKLADAPLDKLTKSRLLDHAQTLEAQARLEEDGFNFPIGMPADGGSPKA